MNILGGNLLSESKYRNELRSNKLISGVLITLSLFSILPSRVSAETEMNSESKQSYNEEKDFNEQIEMFKNLEGKENSPKTAESNNLQEFNKESSITDGSQNILLAESDEGKDVLDLKIMLEALGYKIDINEYFDLETTDSVIHFQDANELKITGVVDLDTINLITYQYEELFSDNIEQYPMEKSSNESTDKVIDFFNEYERNEDLTFEDSEENKINTFNTVHQQAKSNVFLKNV